MSDCTRHKVHNNKKLLREKINNIKRHSSCIYCGESHPSCLEFHHTDQLNKETEICKMLSKYTEEEIMEEIKKCVVVCSNCHRKIHWVEKNARNRPIKQPVV